MDWNRVEGNWKQLKRGLDLRTPQQIAFYRAPRASGTLTLERIADFKRLACMK
jgi:hypothetical protein